MFGLRGWKLLKPDVSACMVFVHLLRCLLRCLSLVLATWQVVAVILSFRSANPSKHVDRVSLMFVKRIY